MANTAMFGTWLRERREEVSPELSQAELARQAGVSKNYVSRLERMGGGDSFQAPIDNPGEARLDALARVLEKYLRRPLVNEGRRAIGYPLLADETPPAERHSLTRDEDTRIAGVLERLLRYSPQKRELAFQLLDVLDRDDRPREWAVAG